MTPTLNEKLIAYLAVLSGLTLSVVAEFYSISGLVAIFSAATIPIIIMGIALGVGKIVATLWLKQNWDIAPVSVKIYLSIAILMLMLITSIGIFGFLSKAHSDQNLVSGDAQAKIAVYDEKIKTAKENIDVNRKALKQLDEAVDQVMGRSTSEAGADKAVAIRRTQANDRKRLLAEIQVEQKTISKLSEERAPLAADLRQIEAEVGPIKYIAAFVYGETSTDLLEKAVTWVIIILIAVFDPLAVILLLASQISFQNFRERKKELAEGDSPEKESDVVSTATVTTSTGFIAQEVGTLVPEAVTEVVEEVITTQQAVAIAKTYIPEKTILEQHPYLTEKFSHFSNLQPMVHNAQKTVPDHSVVEQNVPAPEKSGGYLDEPLFVQNEEQTSSGLWTKTAKNISQDAYQEIGTSRQDLVINDWINKVKTGQIQMTDIPKHILPDVRAKM
jgi:hypothetical protein